MDSDLIEKRANDTAGFLIATVMGDRKLGLEGRVGQLISEFATACEQAGQPPPPFTVDYYKLVAFELLSFATLHVALFAGQRDDLGEDEKVLFVRHTLNRLEQLTCALGGDLRARLREYSKCRSVDALRLYFRMNVGTALGGAAGTGGYAIGSLVCSVAIAGYPELAREILDRILGAAAPSASGKVT